MLRTAAQRGHARTEVPGNHASCWPRRVRGSPGVCRLSTPGGRRRPAASVVYGTRSNTRPPAASLLRHHRLRCRFARAFGSGSASAAARVGRPEQPSDHAPLRCLLAAESASVGPFSFLCRRAGATGRVVGRPANVDQLRACSRRRVPAFCRRAPTPAPPERNPGGKPLRRAGRARRLGTSPSRPPGSGSGPACTDRRSPRGRASSRRR